MARRCTAVEYLVAVVEQSAFFHAARIRVINICTRLCVCENFIWYKYIFFVRLNMCTRGCVGLSHASVYIYIYIYIYIHTRGCAAIIYKK